jgi:nitrous oxidase accessory protein
MTITTLAALLQLQVTTLTVGLGGTHTTITEALAAADAGDTVRVAAGVYHEHPIIERRVVLLGETGAVIEGGGRGIVLSINAPATVRGFTIRGSGADQYREHAGILATRADGLVVENNRLEDVLFGVYIKQSDSVVIRRNVIAGKNLAVPLRGDGIRLWYSHQGQITANHVSQTRDVVIWFSDGTVVRENYVGEGRYGLHYMYSNDNVFEQNQFVANHVGAFIMYSKNITFRNNLFAAARGTTGRGLGFKDADRITAEGNTLVKNAIGISIDNSPYSVGVENVFHRNVIAYNDVAVSLLPSVHSNIFSDNDFVDNVQPVSVSGGGTALGNTWRQNYWSEYAGFDADGDGVGDAPFVAERLSDDMFAKHEDLQLLNLSPALRVLNTLSRVLPFLAPQPIVVDSGPRVDPVVITPVDTNSEGGLSVLPIIGFALTAAVALFLTMGLRHPFRSPW